MAKHKARIDSIGRRDDRVTSVTLTFEKDAGEALKAIDGSEEVEFHITTAAEKATAAAPSTLANTGTTGKAVPPA